MASAQLVFLVYISKIRCSIDEIDEIVLRSCQRNAASKMTGALFHDATHFLQFLEGPSTASADTILRIMGDMRHDEVKILICEPTEVRLFSKWHMKRVVLHVGGKTLCEKMKPILDASHEKRGHLLRRFALELEQPIGC